MGNTPSAQGASPQASAGPVGRHASVSRRQQQQQQQQQQQRSSSQSRENPPPPTTTTAATALPPHRTTHLHDPFAIPGRPPAQSTTSTTSLPPALDDSSGPTSPNPTSPSSLRPSGSPRRRKSLELPDLNRLSLTSMVAPAPVPVGETVVVSPTGRPSPLGKPVVDAGHQASSGTGKRMSLMTGTRAHGPEKEPPTQYIQDNPYFPAVPRAVPQPTTPMTPAALPNYSYSPGDTGSHHTEDVTHPPAAAPAPTPKDASQDFSRPIQPKAAKPAPAIVTRDIHDHDPIAPAATPKIVSGLPQGLVTPAGGPPGVDDLTPHAHHLERERERERERDLQTEADDGLVPTLVTWNGGGKEVFVTGTFAENGWRTRLRMNKSTHDFSLLLNLPPGTHRIKFIVDDHWRCSNDLQTATDGDGNLVNWLEVDVPRRGVGGGGRDEEEDWAQADWAQKVRSELDDDDPSLWTDEIPWALVEFQQMEEEALSDPPDGLTSAQTRSYRQRCATILSQLPVPPALPPHLNKVILNVTPKELEGTVGGTAGDDNSILPVPNHVVLNHLTASAIKNDTLAVGTTTRYRRKYISTIYFKPVEDPL